MITVLHPEGGLPIHVWSRALPDAARVLLERLARHPDVVDHVAVMPDAHAASGVAVGTVFATERTIIPVALGGDLGCGMSALRFSFPAAALSRRDLERLLEDLGRAIPVGDAVHRGRGVTIPDALLESPLSTHALTRTRARLAPRHLGTLGGGNHFVELDRDGGGDLWLLVHSGSRGLGAAIGAHHTRAADAAAPGTSLPALRVDTEAGAACRSDLEWALRFAHHNRRQLLLRAVEVLGEHTGVTPDPDDRIDAHHNFVRAEEHGGRTLWIHRKGAISASSGERALIPGSMATASYVVEGLGEPRSFRSASHGAGRVLTRKEAHASLDPGRFEHRMRRVVHDPRRRHALIEESPDAYRDLVEVLEDEADLVRPLLRLEPVAVLKG